MPFALRATLNALLLGVTYAAVWQVWTRHLQLSWTLVLLFAAALVAGLINRAPAPLPGPGPAEDPEAGAPPSALIAAIAATAGMALAWMALRASVNEQWWGLALSLFAGGLCWRFAAPGGLPDLKPRVWAGLGALVLAVAALFRFYKGGEIPLGMASMDEPLLWWRTHSYAQGLRQTYAMGDNLFEGIIPFYFQMAGLKLFGQSFLGWRLESMIVGTALTVLVWGIAREVAGRWAAFLAASIWAFSVWPVTYARLPYFMNETWLLVLACFWLLLRAIRRGGALTWVFAGLFWGFSFNAYPAARVLAALVPWLLLLHVGFEPRRRQALKAGLLPLGTGLLIALSPLLLWAYKAPGEFGFYYFAAFQLAHQGGNIQGSILQRMGTTLANAVNNFPNSYVLFGKGGPRGASLFPVQYPLLLQPVFLFFLAGVGVCLARFRRPLHAFMLYWLLVSFIPAVASAPGTTPSDRRLMMVVPPTLIIAGLGMAASAGVFSRWMSGAWRAWAVMAALVVALTAMGQRSWDHYFERNQKDYGLLATYHANATALWRAVMAENAKGPCVMVSTRRSNTDSWMQPNLDPFRGPELIATNPGMLVLWAQENTEYYQQGGMVSQLRWALDQRQKNGEPFDVLVLLTPFHFYLEPTLKGMGAQLVAEVPLARSNQGLLMGDVGMAPHASLAGKLLRFNDLTKDTIDKAAAEHSYRLELQELQPPAPYKRQQVLLMNNGLPEYKKLADAYRRNPGAWAKVGAPVRFNLLDPYFWHIHGSLWGEKRGPWRISLPLRLEIPADGDYAFGGSATGPIRLRLDGRTVFDRDASDPSQWKEEAVSHPDHAPGKMEFMNERRGYVGQPLRLRKGSYRLDCEFTRLSAEPLFNEVLRVVWQAPGREIETLPLEVGRPWRP